MLRLLSIIIVLTVVWLFIKPISLKKDHSSPRPINDYQESVETISQIQNKEEPQINPVCKTTLLSHGKKVQKVIVLIHGYTSCPKMYEKLARQFYEGGYNVLIPRLPHHGLKNRLTEDLKNLTAEELTSYTSSIIDISQGLGEKVTVAGISAGGVLAFWVAQERPDVDLSVSIAPSFENYTLSPLGRPYLNFLRIAPNFFIWWDPKNKDSLKGPTYAYPRFSTRGLAEVYRIGDIVFDSTQRPKAEKFLLMINEVDEQVDNNIPLAIVDRWRRSGAQNIEVYTFDKNLKLVHDLISPEQEKQKIKVVYPILFSQIDKQ